MSDRSAEMVMTNGQHTVPVIRSAFEDVWAGQGWTEAEEGAEQTERVLGLGEEPAAAATPARPATPEGGVTPKGDSTQSTRPTG